jgi:hypothetical protein
MQRFILPLIVLFHLGCSGGRAETRDGGTSSETATSTKAATVSEQQALEIAQKDAKSAYRDLSIYKVTAHLEGDRWVVDYELKDEGMLGGGPHYIISAETGEILSRRYEQ